MTRSLAFLLTLLTMALTACSDRPSASAADGADGAEGALTGRITITGSSTMAPLVNAIGKRFESQHPDVRVDVQTGGSSRGIADAQRGTADIGMSSRALTDAEREGVATHVLANDGVCFIVHRDNPVTELTSKQLVDIYRGEVESWSAVGGRDAPITVINRADGRSELKLVTRHFDIQPKDIAADVIAGENQQGIKLVAGDPNAITYMSVGTSEYEANAGTAIRLLPLDGVPASTKTVGSGTFPLTRPLVLITRPEPSPLMQAFLDFALSGAVDDLVREHSFVPLQP